MRGTDFFFASTYVIHEVENKGLHMCWQPCPQGGFTWQAVKAEKASRVGL